MKNLIVVLLILILGFSTTYSKSFSIDFFPELKQNLTVDKFEKLLKKKALIFEKKQFGGKGNYSYKILDTNKVIFQGNLINSIFIDFTDNKLQSLSFEYNKNEDFLKFIDYLVINADKKNLVKYSAYYFCYKNIGITVNHKDKSFITFNFIDLDVWCHFAE